LRELIGWQKFGVVVFFALLILGLSAWEEAHPSTAVEPLRPLDFTPATVKLPYDGSTHWGFWLHCEWPDISWFDPQLIPHGRVVEISPLGWMEREAGGGYVFRNETVWRWLRLGENINTLWYNYTVKIQTFRQVGGLMEAVAVYEYAVSWVWEVAPYKDAHTVRLVEDGATFYRYKIVSEGEYSFYRYKIVSEGEYWPNWNADSFFQVGFSPQTPIPPNRTLSCEVTSLLKGEYGYVIMVKTYDVVTVEDAPNYRQRGYYEFFETYTFN